MNHLVVVLDKNDVQKVLLTVQKRGYDFLYPSETIGYDANIVIISYGKTSTELSNELGFNESDKIHGMVFKIDQYSGFASRFIWDWLSAREV